jgi:predicted ATP-grasp superfamily ATP-dependent carboligase
VQEKIVGPDAAHMSYMAFVPDSGVPVGEIVVVKHRIYPPRFGVACFAESMLTEDAIETGRDVLQRLGYRGFVSVQLKRDERDGKLYLIELNLRLPLAVQLPVSAGAEFPYFYYLASVGQPIEHAPVRVGQRWMAFGRDYRSMKTYAREGTHSWFAWALDLARMPAFAILSLRDPMPTVAGVADSMTSALRRRFSRSARSDFRSTGVTRKT